MRWQVKCFLDNCKGVLPAQDLLRRAKRSFVPYRRFPARERAAISEGIEQIRWTGPRDAIVLEIGSGWMPLIPVLFALAGARKVYMTDLTRLCDQASLSATRESLLENASMIVERLGIERDSLHAFLEWNPAAPVDTILQTLRLQYLAPCDCRRTSFQEGSVDVVVSRAVLEHVRPEWVEELFSEMRRILRPGGRMCHFIDPGDHWEFGDKRISSVNFLRFSDWQYRLVCLNELNYHNRLRHPEYISMLRNAGFEVVREQRVVDSKAVEALQTLKIQERFRGFSPEDLASVDSRLLAQRI